MCQWCVSGWCVSGEPKASYAESGASEASGARHRVLLLLPVVVVVVVVVVLVLFLLLRAQGAWAQSVGLRPPLRSRWGYERASLGHVQDKW